MRYENRKIIVEIILLLWLGLITSGEGGNAVYGRSVTPMSVKVLQSKYKFSVQGHNYANNNFTDTHLFIFHNSWSGDWWVKYSEWISCFHRWLRWRWSPGWDCCRPGILRIQGIQCATTLTSYLRCSNLGLSQLRIKLFCNILILTSVCKVIGEFGRRIAGIAWIFNVKHRVIHQWVWWS